MDSIDKRIIEELYDGIPIRTNPFAKLSRKLVISQEEILSRLKSMIKDRTIKKFGATLGHTKVGYEANAMVVWKLPKEKVEEAGRLMSKFKQISHVYERGIVPGKWEYNIYSMIHCPTRKDVERIVEDIANQLKTKDYRLIYSKREFKKTAVPLG